MTISLTENAVQRLNQGRDDSFKPIVQIISVRTVNKKQGAGPDRFRMVLSDGSFFIQGMVATQLNDLFLTNKVTTNSVIRITSYLINSIQNRRLCVIMSFDIVDANQTERIGDPKDFDVGFSHDSVYNNQNSNENSAPAASTAPPPMYNRTNNSDSYGGSKNNSGSPPTKPNPYASPGNRNPYSNSRSSYGGGGVSNAPIVHNQSSGAGGPRTTPISQLNMYQNRFTIKGRVTSKGEVRTWANAKGEGTLMSIEVLDASGTDMRITMFKETVAKYENYFQVGDVYTITGGRLKVANSKYNTCKSNFEMTIDLNTEVVKVDDAKDIKSQLFEFIKIGDLEQQAENSKVDIIGIVQEVGEVQKLISKRNGQELLKADVTIIDDTGVQVRLTLWGNSATNAAQSFKDQPVVASRRARVSDYGGKTLSGGDIFVEPDVPETEDVRRWWKSQGSRSAPLKSLSSSGGGGRMDGFNDRKTIADIKNQHMGRNNEKGDYLTFKGHFTFLKKDKEGGAWYTACPNKDEPCRNRCKINQGTDGNYHCDRCNGTFPNCNHKWIFSATVADGMASSWVNIFDEQAQQLLGTSADDVFVQTEQGHNEHYDAVFAKAAFSEWIFKCRVKEEDVNGEMRLKTQVVRMEPVNYVTECRDMIAALERL